jgi:two-component system, OmpR family, phosphate regulon sensor histidine kinase PhoR
LHGLQWRITVPLTILIIVSMIVLGAFLTNSVRNSQLSDLRFHLEQKARITAEVVLPSLSGDGENPDVLAKKLGSEIDTRITFIAPNGTVLGDSVENPSTMENHANRPEVIDALATGTGQSTRYSTTLNQQLMYVAVQINNEGRVLGIARVALPLTTVENTTSSVRWIIITAMLIITLLTVIATWIITRLTTRPIRQLTKAAQGIAAGQLGQKIIVSTKDEAGQLAHSFNEMSANLKTTVDTMSMEKNRLSGILANMADGVIMTDNQGDIVLANRAAGNLLSFKEENAAGKPLIEVVHDHEIDEVLKKCLTSGQEQTIQFESGITKRFLRGIAVPLLIQGRLNGVLILLQDLTELRSLQTMRRELVGNISHELRTPIAGIKAMVETLLDGAIDDKDAAKDFLYRIQSEVDRLTQIVSEITQLSRIESGQAELKKETVNINILVSDIVQEITPLAERQQVTLSKKLVPNLPVVNADKDRIRQAIINLVHNAIKFNKTGGSVIVSTFSNKNTITLTVTDTGIGISKEDLPHVFERFYKAEKSRTGGGGSGLGLAIVKHTVQAHGGIIRAESDEGIGSTFSFTIPVE